MLAPVLLPLTQIHANAQINSLFLFCVHLSLTLVIAHSLSDTHTLYCLQGFGSISLIDGDSRGRKISGKKNSLLVQRWLVSATSPLNDLILTSLWLPAEENNVCNCVEVIWNVFFIELFHPRLLSLALFLFASYWFPPLVLFQVAQCNTCPQLMEMNPKISKHCISLFSETTLNHKTLYTVIILTLHMSR